MELARIKIPGTRGQIALRVMDQAGRTIGEKRRLRDCHLIVTGTMEKFAYYMKRSG